MAEFEKKVRDILSANNCRHQKSNKINNLENHLRRS